MTDDLNAMADWLIACGVDAVALESTGVYWIPVYEVLEQHGLKVWLVDARQMKYVPGRKSDVLDCQWLQKLMSLGLLRAAWRPEAEVCVVRAVTRQREVLLIEQASWVQRMQKALVQMNLQLTEVLSDVMGITGQAIIRAIVAGERDAKPERISRPEASGRACTGRYIGPAMLSIAIHEQNHLDGADRPIDVVADTPAVEHVANLPDQGAARQHAIPALIAVRPLQHIVGGMAGTAPSRHPADVGEIRWYQSVSASDQQGIHCGELGNAPRGCPR